MMHRPCRMDCSTVFRDSWLTEVLVAAWPFESDGCLNHFHLWWSQACLAARILSKLQKSTWWVTLATAKGEIQTPNFARRTGASALLRQCVTLQSNDKDRRRVTPGINTVGRNRGLRDGVAVWHPVALWNERITREGNVSVHWGAAASKVLTVGETGPWTFHTRLDTLTSERGQKNRRAHRCFERDQQVSPLG